jgi:hypothetical protein
MQINWDEYKEYKKFTNGSDNFEILLKFVKSFYNMHSPSEIFALFQEDETASLMLQKRNIKDAEDLENFLFKH